MPIINRQDASDVELRMQSVFGAGSRQERVGEIRRLFVETLDFEPASGEVSLAGGRRGVELPDSAARVASLEGVNVAYVHLDTRRVRRAEASEAVRLVSNQLDGDLLTVFTNQDASQLHLIYPNFKGVRPTLRRMVIERDLPRRTAVMQLSNIYWRWRDTGSLHAALDSAFDVEAVTREFFTEYKSVFDRALDDITGFGPDETEQEAKKVFAQTLFNRLMFVYFISRKGWLSFDGDRDYLNALWNDYSKDANPPSDADDWGVGSSNFYADRLRLLFFAGLNNYRSRDTSSDPETERLIGNPPFLNGGLFDRTDEDELHGVFVPDSVIRSMFDDLFERFNFTVMESTPFDIEVAVDPEMLGKVFEELVTGRHDSGAYYTPRPVVSFMCREALKGYLGSRIAALDEDAIRAFVDDRDTSGVSVSDAREIGRALDEVTVVDPACGSGAYLLGMMQELVELQTELYNVGLNSKSLYDLKLQIIERNLYGADLDRFAVNIAMLRLWLSLSIEYDDPGDPPPLPNLDFKIVRGDSLLGPDPSPDNYGDLFRHQVNSVAERLAGLKARFQNAIGPAKDSLRKQIEAVQSDLTDALADSPAPENAVDWRVQFGEVFVKGGFDIAVANPPYGITIQDERSSAIGNSDSYTNFMARAIEIAPSGIMAYITPTSWETGDRFKDFRKFLFENMALGSVVNLPYDVFETPYVDTAITVGSIGHALGTNFSLATLDKREEIDLTQIGDYLEQVDWSAVETDSKLRVPQIGWAANLFAQISDIGTPLGRITNSKRGIEAYMYEIMDRPTKDARSFFTGQVQRYEVRDLTDENFVVVSERDALFHEGERILTRRIVSRANRLMSAYTKDEFVVKKDIYVIKAELEDRDSFLSLLAILNSSLTSFLYLSRSTAAVKDDFRQVTLAGLRELPVILPESPEQKSELAHLVSSYEREDADFQILDDHIDKIVYELYGVTEEEQGAIASWLSRSG